MWHRVEVVLIDVSEERIASIFRVEGKIRKSAREASVRDVKSSLHYLMTDTSKTPPQFQIFKKKRFPFLPNFILFNIYI
jgi:hypothetical protein